MDPSEESPLSLWMVRAAELFPKTQIEKEDDALNVPFTECELLIFFVIYLHTLHNLIFSFFASVSF